MIQLIILQIANELIKSALTSSSAMTILFHYMYIRVYTAVAKSQ